MPAPEGFPKVIRLPVGFVGYPPPDNKTWIHGQRLPDWLGENMPPDALSDPYGMYHALTHGAKDWLKVAGQLVVWDELP
jgi:hypothetical protein